MPLQPRVLDTSSRKICKFSFSEQKIVEDDNWDIALRGTTILVNGGFSGSSDEPSRSGLGGYVETEYGSIKSIDESKLKQDSESEKAIPIEVVKVGMIIISKPCDYS